MLGEITNTQIYNNYASKCIKQIYIYSELSFKNKVLKYSHHKLEDKVLKF